MWIRATRSHDDRLDVRVVALERGEGFLDAIVDRDEAQVVALLRRLDEQLDFREGLTTSDVQRVQVGVDRAVLPV